MLKKIIFMLLFLPVFILVAQNNVLTHIVKPGENITQIASLYKVKISDIFTLNKIDHNSIIKAGKKLLIPMGGTVAKNEKQIVKNSSAPANSPSVHVIEQGESLYKISKDNNVSIQQLRLWNNLENDNIKIGEIIYLKPQKSAAPTEVVQIKVNQEEEVSKSLKTAAKDSENKVNVIDKVIENNQYQKPEKVAVTAEKPDYSVFEKQFKPTNKSVIGLCGTFKTISGWKDKKYYALMNDAVNGSIVKVKVDNKFIYAKVLGPLPNVKEDSNLTLRISNAAAAALGLNYELFEAKIEQ